MSARGQGVLTNRSELFAPSTGRTGEGESKDGRLSARDRLQYEVGDDESDPLQLEHMLGYTGKHKQTVVALPQDENMYIKR